MKSASGISEVKRTLEEKDGNVNVKMIENCGMPEERIYERIEDVPEQAGYYSLLIVKESEKERSPESKNQSRCTELENKNSTGDVYGEF